MASKHAERITDKAVGLLAAERKRLGLSHEKLAERAGIHRSAVSLIESGKRRPTLLVCYKLALAMGLSLSDVLGDAEVK